MHRRQEVHKQPTLAVLRSRAEAKVGRGLGVGREEEYWGGGLGMPRHLCVE